MKNSCFSEHSFINSTKIVLKIKRVRTFPLSKKGGIVCVLPLFMFLTREGPMILRDM